MSMNEMKCCCGTYGCRQGADLAGNARSFSDHGNLRCIIQAACLQELDVDVITSLFSNRHERVSWAVDAFVEHDRHFKATAQFGTTAQVTSLEGLFDDVDVQGFNRLKEACRLYKGPSLVGVELDAKSGAALSADGEIGRAHV